MLTESARVNGRLVVGTCAHCGAALYGGALGPEHLRHSQDRDHTAVPQSAVVTA